MGGYSTFRKYYEEKKEKSLLFRLSECMLSLLVLALYFYLCFCVEVRRALARTTHRVFSKREYQSNPDFRMSRGIVDIEKL